MFTSDVLPRLSRDPLRFAYGVVVVSAHVRRFRYAALVSFSSVFPVLTDSFVFVDFVAVVFYGTIQSLFFSVMLL